MVSIPFTNSLDDIHLPVVATVVRAFSSGGTAFVRFAGVVMVFVRFLRGVSWCLFVSIRGTVFVRFPRGCHPGLQTGDS